MMDSVLKQNSVPAVLELDALRNQLKEKEEELNAAKSEVDGIKASIVHKDKAIEELKNQVLKSDEKIRTTEKLVEKKNLEAKKLADDKKDAVAAQYAAEAALRRLYENQMEDDHFPFESIIAPLEAEIKLYKNEITALQEDKKALERLTKAKESALVEAEGILHSALERALIVEEVQNQNFELRRQIEICQEENKILEKTNRQKILEVEKLCRTIKDLEEAILAGGAAANAIRDYRRQISELNEEKRTLERELARVKISANRVASVVANEWKDENDKVMPVRQWLEERKMLQAEMQRLKDKLAISDRTAKAEAQIKERLKLRLKTLEDGLKNSSSLATSTNACYDNSKQEKTGNVLRFLTSNSGAKKRSTSRPRASTVARIRPSEYPFTDKDKNHTTRENALRTSGIWASKSKVVDGSGKENAEMSRQNMDANIGKVAEQDEMKNKAGATENGRLDGDDVVSGFLYDRLQKEVINLRKACEAKASSLNAKDNEIKMLMKKVEALTKAVEVESKKAKREAAAAREKDHEIVINKENRKSRDSSTKRVSRAY